MGNSCISNALEKSFLGVVVNLDSEESEDREVGLFLKIFGEFHVEVILHSEQMPAFMKENALEVVVG